MRPPHIPFPRKIPALAVELVCRWWHNPRVLYGPEIPRAIDEARLHNQIVTQRVEELARALVPRVRSGELPTGSPEYMKAIQGSFTVHTRVQQIIQADLPRRKELFL